MFRSVYSVLRVVFVLSSVCLLLVCVWCLPFSVMTSFKFGLFVRSSAPCLWFLFVSPFLLSFP